MPIYITVSLQERLKNRLASDKGEYMILYYTDSSEESIVKYVSQVTQDDCLSIQKRIEQNDTTDLFSGKAYVFIIGMHSGEKHSLYENLVKTKFKGSKILYCLFMTRRNHASFRIAEFCIKKKGLILFGYDFINPDIAQSPAKQMNSKLQTTAELIRDCIPIGDNKPLRICTI